MIFTEIFSLVESTNLVLLGRWHLLAVAFHHSSCSMCLLRLVTACTAHITQQHRGLTWVETSLNGTASNRNVGF
jgi:hypothetical protein